MSLILPGAIAAVAGIAMWRAGRRRGAGAEEMRRLRTTPAVMVRPGDRVEVKGTAHPLAAVLAPGDVGPCVLFIHRLEQREDTRGADGRLSHRWVLVEQGLAGNAFLVRDGTGDVPVDPADAEVEAPHLLSETGTTDSLSLRARKLDEGRLGGRPARLTVWGIRPGSRVFVVGDAVAGPDGKVRIARGTGGLTISTKSEEELTGTAGRAALLLTLGGGLLVIAGLAALLSVIAR